MSESTSIMSVSIESLQQTIHNQAVELVEAHLAGMRSAVLRMPYRVNLSDDELRRLGAWLTRNGREGADAVDWVIRERRKVAQNWKRRKRDSDPHSEPEPEFSFVKCVTEELGATH